MHIIALWKPMRYFQTAQRVASTVASTQNHSLEHVTPVQESAKDIILKQLEFKIDLPRAKTWSDTAVLEALASTVQRTNPLSYEELESPHYWFYGTHPRYRRRFLGMKGRAAANFVIENYPKLFEHDFSADSVDNWISLENEEIMRFSENENEETELENVEDLSKEASEDKSEEVDTIEVLQNHVEQKRVLQAFNTFSRMYKEGADIPDDLVNKVLGLSAFYKASSTNAKKIEMDPLNAVSVVCRESGPSNVSEKISEFYKTYSTDSAEALGTKILSFPNTTKADCFTVLSIFENEIPKEMKLHIDVYNYVLLCVKDTPQSSHYTRAKRILEVMKHHGVKPNYESFTHFARYLPRDCNTPEKMLKYYSKLLNEMKELSINPGPAFYLSMLYTVNSPGFRPYAHEVKSAILDNMLETVFQVQHLLDITAFYHISALCRNSLTLLKKVMLISSYGSNSIFFDNHHDKSFLFYIHFFLGLLKDDTLENVFYYIRKLVPYKITIEAGVRDKLIARIEEEKRPEYLPILLLYFPLSKYYTDFKKWLTAAVNLLNWSDADTRLQLKHIAILEINFCGRQGDDVLLNDVVNLCFELLLSTSDKFLDVSPAIERLIERKIDVTIDEQLLTRFHIMGKQQNREQHAAQLVEKLKSRRKKRM